MVKNKWHFLLEPYMMFPNMQGTTGLGDLPNAEVDENAEIFLKIFNSVQCCTLKQSKDSGLSVLI